MSMNDDYANKKVTFDTQDSLEEKIDRLTTIMTKLMTQDKRQDKQFKPKIYQDKRRGQMGNFYDKCNYAQRNYQNRFRPDCRGRRISFMTCVQHG